MSEPLSPACWANWRPSERQVTSRARNLAVLGLVVCTLFWAGNTVFARVIHSTIPPIAANFWRWAVALLILLPLTWPEMRKHRAAIRREWFYLATQAALAISIFNTLLYLSAQTTSTLNITLVNAMGPVVTFMFSWWLLNSPPRANQLVGLIIAFTGLAVVLFAADPKRLLALELNRGDLWMSLGMVGWCLYTVRLKQSPLKMPPLAFLAVLVIIGTGLMLPFYLLELAIVGGFELTLERTGIFLYMGIFGSVIAFYFWNRGIELLGPNVAIMFQYLLPVFAGLQALLFLGEPIRGYHIAGELMIFAGFYVALFAGSGQGVRQQR